MSLDELTLGEIKQIKSLLNDGSASQVNDGFTGRYCMVRTYSAGVFAGTVAKREGKEILLTGARRIWYWAGAASLSQLATDGTSKPAACKFPAAVPSVLLTEVIEIIPISLKAEESIKGVQEWQQ